MRTPIVITAAAAALAIPPWWLLQAPAAPAGRAAPVPAVVAERPQAAAALPASTSSPAQIAQEAVRRFELGFGGGVVVNEDTRRTVEMALSALSDPPTEQELRQLQATLAASLTADDVRRAMALTRGYAAYTAEMRQEVPVGPAPTTLAEFDALAARIEGIRRRHFDADTAYALFGPHDGYARIVLQASLVETDPRLSGEEKLAQLAALRELLPKEQQALISSPVRPPRS